MTLKSNISKVSLVFSLFFVVSCLKTVQPVGYTFDDKMVEKIISGESRKAVVEQFLGSPSATSTFGSEIWYYISRQYQKKAFFKPKLISQKIIAIEFNDEVVSSIKQYTEEDAKNIAFVKDATPAEGHDVTLAGQLLGNIGRFNSKGRKVPGEP
jgi:outer membrane protein assembly factor BamE (lipoprotein component of BamABCDE complex)